MMSDIASLATKVLADLRNRDEKLATAESLTGGLLSGAITDIPGSSDVFLGGVIAYDEHIKINILKVDGQLIADHGVVSGEVARAMALGVQSIYGSDWAISTTGVAGPGPSGDVPAGTVWIAVAGPAPMEPYLEKLSLSGNRQEVRSTTIARALTAITRILNP